MKNKANLLLSIKANNQFRTYLVQELTRPPSQPLVV